MNYKHGLKGTRFENIFHGLRKRCSNTSQKDYFRYGGRGIKNEWKDVLSFKKDMYASYLEHVERHGEKDTTIDRIDSNGNYFRENCRWTTWKKQKRNQNNNREITFRGKTQLITDWSKELEINYQTLYSRLGYKGWSIEKALSTPVRK